ncbi:unnamed protein product [Discosporangium mesarthrocarpum]
MKPAAAAAAAAAAEDSVQAQQANPTTNGDLSTEGAAVEEGRGLGSLTDSGCSQKPPTSVLGGGGMVRAAPDMPLLSTPPKHPVPTKPEGLQLEEEPTRPSLEIFVAFIQGVAYQPPPDVYSQFLDLFQVLILEPRYFPPGCKGIPAYVIGPEAHVKAALPVLHQIQQEKPTRKSFVQLAFAPISTQIRRASQRKYRQISKIVEVYPQVAEAMKETDRLSWVTTEIRRLSGVTDIFVCSSVTIRGADGNPACQVTVVGTPAQCGEAEGLMHRVQEVYGEIEAFEANHPAPSSYAMSHQAKIGINAAEITSEGVSTAKLPRDKETSKMRLGLGQGLFSKVTAPPTPPRLQLGNGMMNGWGRDIRLPHKVGGGISEAATPPGPQLPAWAGATSISSAPNKEHEVRVEDASKGGTPGSAPAHTHDGTPMQNKGVQKAGGLVARSGQSAAKPALSNRLRAKRASSSSKLVGKGKGKGKAATVTVRPKDNRGDPMYKPSTPLGKDAGSNLGTAAGGGSGGGTKAVKASKGANKGKQGASAEKGRGALGKMNLSSDSVMATKKAETVSVDAHTHSAVTTATPPVPAPSPMAEEGTGPEPLAEGKSAPTSKALKELEEPTYYSTPSAAHRDKGLTRDEIKGERSRDCPVGGEVTATATSTAAEGRATTPHGSQRGIPSCTSRSSRSPPAAARGEGSSHYRRPPPTAHTPPRSQSPAFQRGGRRLPNPGRYPPSRSPSPSPGARGRGRTPPPSRRGRGRTRSPSRRGHSSINRSLGRGGGANGEGDRDRGRNRYGDRDRDRSRSRDRDWDWDRRYISPTPKNGGREDRDRDRNRAGRDWDRCRDKGRDRGGNTAGRDCDRGKVRRGRSPTPPRRPGRPTHSPSRRRDSRKERGGGRGRGTSHSYSRSCSHSQGRGSQGPCSPVKRSVSPVKGARSDRGPGRVGPPRGPAKRARSPSPTDHSESESQSPPKRSRVASPAPPPAGSVKLRPQSPPSRDRSRTRSPSNSNRL